MRKIKRFIRRLLPAAASIVVGATLTPAAGLIASALAAKLTSIGINVATSEVESIALQMIQSPGSISRITGLLSSKAVPASKDFNETTIKASVEYAVRDVMSELKNAIEELKQRQDLLFASVQQLQMVSGQMSAEALTQLFQGLSDAPHMDTTTIVDRDSGSTVSDSTMMYIPKIEEMLSKLDEMDRKLDDLQERSYQQLTEEITPINIHVASLTQVLLAETSSRYDIKYDPEIYVPRSSVEYTFVSLLENLKGRKPKNIFIVLADVGMGKTWTLANMARQYSIKGYPSFFISLRMGLKDQLEYIFNTEFFKVPAKIRKYYEVSGKPVLLFLDGLDEVESSERSEIMRFVASMKSKKEVVIILSCRITDWEIDPYISDYYSSINKAVFSNTSKDIPYSVKLEEFNDEEFFNALERYNLPYFEGVLSTLAKKPFFMRLVADFYSKNGRLPNPDNIEEFLTIIADPKSLSVFTRIGLRGYARTKLLELVEHMLSKGKDTISDEDFLEILDDRNIRSRLISSGMLIQEETKYGMNIRLNEIYGFYLAILALRRLDAQELKKIFKNAVKVYPKLRNIFHVEVSEELEGKTEEGNYRFKIRIGRNEYTIDVPTGTVAIFRNPISGTVNVVVNGKVYDIGIADRTLSRNKHALFNVETDKITVTDLNSTNGIYMNNERIPANKPVKIELGKEIRLGLNSIISISKVF